MDNQREDALKKILKRLPAQFIYYGSALGAILLTAGVSLPAGLEFIAGGIGANILSELISDIVKGKDVLDDEIRERALDAIEKSDITNLLSQQEFLEKYAELVKILEQQNIVSAEILTELKSGFAKVATQEQVAELKALLESLHKSTNEAMKARKLAEIKPETYQFATLFRFDVSEIEKNRNGIVSERQKQHYWDYRGRFEKEIETQIQLEKTRPRFKNWSLAILMILAVSIAGACIYPLYSIFNIGLSVLVIIALVIIGTIFILFFTTLDDLIYPIKYETKIVPNPDYVEVSFVTGTLEYVRDDLFRVGGTTWRFWFISSKEDKEKGIAMINSRQDLKNTPIKVYLFYGRLLSIEAV